MARIPHSAKTLSRQITARYKRAKVVPSGNPDGLNVIRTIRVSGKPAVTWLTGLLDHLKDPRIVGYEKDGDALLVHFAASSNVADRPVEFDLDDAETIAQSSTRS